VQTTTGPPPDAPSPDAEGLFPPDSLFRRVNREAVLVLSGPRALLLQLAHPLVAQGVDDHSDFLGDTLGRLWRTLDTMLTIIFADRTTALATAGRLNAAHARVQGALREGTRAFPPGTPYDARDPALAAWVGATLIDSALQVYQRWVKPLSPDERRVFYEESKTVSRVLGVSDAAIPADHTAFEHYMARMLAGPELEVTPTARRLGDAVLHPPIRGVPRFAGDLLSPLTIGLLPPRLRAGYGLPWDRKRRMAFRLADRSLRAGMRVLPAGLRSMPHARRADRRA